MQFFLEIFVSGLGALLSLLRSDFKRNVHRSRPLTRSTSEQRTSNTSSSRERKSLETGNNNSSIDVVGGSNDKTERSSRDVVFPDSFEVLPQPRNDMGAIYLGGVSHEQQRKFRCRFCGKGYRWKSTMRRHESVECGGKPPAYQCPQCPYKARQRGNLTVHYKRHHNKIDSFDDNTHLDWYFTFHYVFIYSIHYQWKQVPFLNMFKLMKKLLIGTKVQAIIN